MLKYILSLFLFSVATVYPASTSYSTALMVPSNACIQFTVGQGTGCAWMCNYCSTLLGTSNYYFTDQVCTYEEGGCVGNPVSGKSYSCCALSA